MARDRAARLRALCCALIALVVPRAAPAATLVAASMRDLPRQEGEPGPAPLDLYVNGAGHGPVEVRLRGGDALVPVEALEAAGLRGLGGSRERADGRVWVSLSSLAPALRHEVDERGIALRVTAAPELLGRVAIDLRPVVRPPGLEPDRAPSGFLNYSVQHRTDGRTSGFAEAGASAGGRLLYTSGQLRADGGAVRGLSSLTLDDAGSLRRLVVGDAFAGGAGLGGGVLLGGVSLAREYGLDPYFVRAPMPGVSGFAPTPATLEVWVNGVLTREVPLPPGGYDVSNLPVTTGAGNVRTVLRDAFGRSEALGWQYYYTPALLAPGLSDYAYSVGFRRLEYGRSSFEYGRPVLVGRHRAGVGERVTLGGRADLAQDLASGGPSATFALPFGTLDLEAAVSAQGGAGGAAASAGYSYVSRRAGGGALVRVLSDRYAHAALRAADDRARLQASVYAGAPVAARVDVGLSGSLLERRDGGSSDVLSARADVRLAKGLTLGITGNRTGAGGGRTVHDLFATLSWAFAPMSVADVSVQAGEGGDATVLAGVQKALPMGTGFGYRARAASAPHGEEGAGVLQYQWDHGRYELQYDRVAASGARASEVVTATVAGGVVAIGDRVFLTRPVQSGYGLIRAGVPGVRGYAEGQEIGRTDRRGDLLVPSLLPYYGNRLGIADRDVPIEYSIGPTELLAAPTFRGGAVARFALTPVRSAEGELVTVERGAEVTPAYGELTVRAPGGPFVSPVGRDGRFYVEQVPPGAHHGEVEWSEGRCRVTLDVPESPSVVALGRVRCEPEGVARSGGGEARAEKVPAAVDEGERREGIEPAGTEAAAPSPIPTTKTTTTTPTPTPTPTATPTPTPTATPTATATATPITTTTTTTTEIPTAAPTTGIPTAAADAPSPPARAGGEGGGEGEVRRDVRRDAPGPPARPARQIRLRAPSCPPCGVCWSAAIERLAAEPGLTCGPLVLPALDPDGPEEARACPVKPDAQEQCAECLGVRRSRRCR